MDAPQVTLRSAKDREIVHLEYDDPLNVPSVSSGYTRFVCVSDTHSRRFPVPDGDVLLHSGDLTNTGTLAEFEQTMDWICGLPHKLKIIIAGNHDLPLHAEWYKQNHARWSGYGHSAPQDLGPIVELLKGKKAQKANVVYLQDELHSFQTTEGGRTWSVYGSPWSPEYLNWAFGYSAAEGPALVAKFPKSDILFVSSSFLILRSSSRAVFRLTHGPPRGVFDRTVRGDLPGCLALIDALPRLRPRLHLFGHIHEAHGAHIHSWSKGNIRDVQNSTLAAQDIELPEAVDSDEVTVFVNAANWPMGQRKQEYMTRQFGGPGFRAVVVDMLD
ncbi:Metallo-dependent phosphatase-like protein [Rhodocollybia butyracea]|uniref:Metallo-dependent phosphatase-like protein n=1 Tax=Rhodocollybia butyracea TaxID=206335 RepID=A0A9P5Q6M6_9AGAR|nr:Metallo-dependent phosphatase-like protein [Rhodocollybia butyracea]